MKVLEKQWSGFSQIWRKNINLDTEKVQKTPKRIKTKQKKITPKQITVRPLKSKDRDNCEIVKF